ncbi:hypothetical protein PRIC2_011365 [Phytophthora ramorum]
MRLCQLLLVGCSILAGSTSAVAASNARSSALMKTARSTTLGGNEIRYQRFLRTQHSGDNDGEERGFDVSKLKKFQTWLLPKTSLEKLDDWLEKGKPAKEVFDRLQLTKFGDKLLDNPAFIAWVKYADDLSAKYPGKAASTIPTLTAEYGDEALFKMLEAAMKAPSTQSLATKLRADQIEHWAVIGKPPGSVLKIFAAEKTASTKSTFADWVKYVDNFNVKHPDEQISQTSMLSTLATQYGDEALFKLLQKAKRIPSTGTIAIKLQAEQIQSLQNRNKHPLDVFAILGLHEVKSNEVFSSPILQTWLKYLDTFKTKFPQDKTTLYVAIRSHYNVRSVVSEAMKNPSTISLAKRVESEKFQWNLQQKQLPASVFYDLMGYPRSFVRTNGAGESQIIMNADNFLVDPMFKTWARYLSAFNKKYPDDKTDMIKSLLLYYTDDTLSQVLITAKQVPSTEKMATKLQLSLLNKWARDKKPPAEVSKLLNVGSSDTLMKMYAKEYDWALKTVVEGNVLENLTKDTWLKYLNDFAEKKHDASSTISQLTDRYGGMSVAQMIEMSRDSEGAQKIAAHALQAAQIKGWLDSKMSGDDVFQLLKLNDKGNMRLDNPLLKRTLQLFIIRFNKENPSAQTSIIETLRRNYGDEILSKIIISGKGVRKTQATASSWQTKLLDKWLEAGIQPSVVFKWLQFKSSALDNTERQVYETYAMKFKTKYPAGRLE